MRFKANIHNADAFHKFVASLSSLGNVAWVRLNSEDVRFTIIPESGTQVWAQLAIETVFETYTIQSASEKNTINLEVPLQPLLRALKSASNATSASLRLTKKDNAPWLVMTVVTTSSSTNYTRPQNDAATGDGFNSEDPFADSANLPENTFMPNPDLVSVSERRERETLITLDIPVVVLAATTVAGLHEPHCREPDVHIYLPPLTQLKSISDRFARLASSSSPSTNSIGNFEPRKGAAAKGPKLDLAATMHGTLRLSYASDALKIASTWRGLDNPELDTNQVPGGQDGLADHPSTIMKSVVPSEDDEGRGWAKVRIDAKDWSRVMSVGRVGGRVIACFCADHALILYCYMPTTDDSMPGESESVLTYYISSISR